MAKKAKKAARRRPRRSAKPLAARGWPTWSPPIFSGHCRYALASREVPPPGRRARQVNARRKTPRPGDVGQAASDRDQTRCGLTRTLNQGRGD